MSRSKTPAAVLKDLMYLKDSGFNIPDELVTYTQWQDWKQRSIAQVWECACGKYESEVKVINIRCPKGHMMKLVWTP